MGSPIGRRHSLDLGAFARSPLVAKKAPAVKAGKVKKEIYKPSDVYKDLSKSVDAMHQLIHDTQHALETEKGIMEEPKYGKEYPKRINKIKNLENRIDALTKVQRKYNEAVKGQNFHDIQSCAQDVLRVVSRARDDIGPEWAFEYKDKKQLGRLKNSVHSAGQNVAEFHNKLFEGVKSLRTLLIKKNKFDKAASKWLKGRMIAQNNNTKLVDKWQGKSSQEIKDFNTTGGFTYKNLVKTCNTIAELYKNHEYLDKGVAAREAQAKVEHDAILKSQDERLEKLSNYYNDLLENRTDKEVVYHLLDKDHTQLSNAVKEIDQRIRSVNANPGLTKKQKNTVVKKLEAKIAPLQKETIAINARLQKCRNTNEKKWNKKDKKALKEVKNWRKQLISWTEPFRRGSKFVVDNEKSLPQVRNLQKRWNKHVFVSKSSLEVALYELEDCLPAHVREEIDVLSNLKKLDTELDKAHTKYTAGAAHRANAATELGELAKSHRKVFDNFRTFKNDHMKNFIVNTLKLDVKSNSEEIKELKKQVKSLSDSRGPRSKIKRMWAEREIDKLTKTRLGIENEIYKIEKEGNYGPYSVPKLKIVKRNVDELESIEKKLGAARNAVEKAITKKQAKAYYEKVQDLHLKAAKQLKNINNFLVASVGVAQMEM